MINTPYFWSF